MQFSLYSFSQVFLFWFWDLSINYCVFLSKRLQFFKKQGVWYVQKNWSHLDKVHTSYTETFLYPNFLTCNISAESFTISSPIHSITPPYSHLSILIVHAAFSLFDRYLALQIPRYDHHSCFLNVSTKIFSCFHPKQSSCMPSVSFKMIARGIDTPKSHHTTWLHG